MQIRGVGPCILEYAEHFYGAVALVIPEPMKRQYYSANRRWACKVEAEAYALSISALAQGFIIISAHLVAFVTNKPIGRGEDIYCMKHVVPLIVL
jgi:hypothetical protein